MRYAVLDKQNNVINVVIHNPASTWQPPYACSIVPSQTAMIGDWYDKESKRFLKPDMLRSTNVTK